MSKTRKVWIRVSEYYPVFEVSEPPSPACATAIPLKLWKEYKSAMAEFERVQRALRALCPEEDQE